MNKEQDAAVLKLFEFVKQRQKEIAATEGSKWVTNCTVGPNPDSVDGRLNIQTCNDVNKLLDMLGFLMMKAEYFEAAALQVDAVNVDFKWMGYKLDQWTADIKNRIAQIGLNAKKAELKTYEARLDALITVEQRRALELAAIKKELGL